MFEHDSLANLILKGKRNVELNFSENVGRIRAQSDAVLLPVQRMPSHLLIERLPSLTEKEDNLEDLSLV